MRSLLTFILWLGSAMTLRADTFVYVSMAPEQKIQIYKLEPRDGKLTEVGGIPVEGAPGVLAVDPEKKYLFASLRTNSKLASFRIDTDTGKLKSLSTVPLGKGENAAYVGTDRTGRWLLSASYAAGKVVVHRINDDGMIQTPAIQTVEAAKTAHCIVTDRDNRFVFVPHVTANAVFQYRLDPASGKLTEAGKAPGGTDKAGPRHLAFHPTLNVAFTSDEQGSSITAYRFNSKEGLKAIQTLSTLPADFKGENTTAEVKVHPSAKFVWVSNRGNDSLAGFAIDAKSDKLTALGQTRTEKTPRSFDISPDGRFVLAAGEGSGKLAVYQVALDTGKLTRLHSYDVGKSLTWVLAIDLEVAINPRLIDKRYEGLFPKNAINLPELGDRSRLTKTTVRKDDRWPGLLEFFHPIIKDPVSILLLVVIIAIIFAVVVAAIGTNILQRSAGESEFEKVRPWRAFFIKLAAGVSSGLVLPVFLLATLATPGAMNSARLEWTLFAIGEFAAPAALLALIGAAARTAGPTRGLLRLWPQLLVVLLTPLVIAGLVRGALLPRVTNEGTLVLGLAFGNAVMAGWISCRVYKRRKANAGGVGEGGGVVA